MKTEILRMLREADGYVSGQTLCQHFGISRTAVWKVINQLKEEGYVIQAVNRKGYALEAVPEGVSAAEVQSRLSAASMYQNIVYVDSLTSSNDYVKQLAEAGAPQGTVVIANQQTAGKGRRGHQWVSPKGQNIYMSFLLKPEIEPMKASMLTLVCALAAQDALKQQGLDPMIKWPNDLILDGKKVAGILTEMSTEMLCINYIVIGIGINVDQTVFDPEISDVATSMQLERAQKYHRAEIIAGLLTAFEGYYQKFLKTCDLSLLKADYEARLANINKEVRIIDSRCERMGKALGIDETGELLVEIDGQVEKVMSGEVSVRGILGYI